jgi:hypothetical protein
MTFTEAAAQVLRLIGKPLHYKEITDVAIERNLLSHVGKSPEVTMGARLAALVKKGDKENPLVRVKPGVFALREWDSATIEKGLADRTPALERLAAQEPADVEEFEAQAALEPDGAGEGGGDEAPVLDPAERERAEMAAHATEFFETEDDDDEPIFGREPEAAAAASDDRGDPGGRRRRRRRRRGGRPEETVVGGGDGLPSYTVSDAPAELPAAALAEAERRASERDRGELGRGEDSDRKRDVELEAPVRERDRGERDRGERERGDRDRGERDRGERGERDRGERSERDRGERSERDRGERSERDRGDRDRAPVNGAAHAGADDVVGRGVADGLESLLETFDRSRGPVAIQTLTDAAQRRGRFFGEHSIAPGVLLAAARTDNTCALSRGERPRFRVAGSRIGLTEWSLDGEIVRIEREIQQLVTRYREASRRVLLRNLQELPHRALGEMVLLLLEQIGFSELVPLRRPGSHGAELHLSGKLRTPAGELQTAVVVRRDGREVGRERVTELRGALHHYGPAHAGWLITTGQVLSGAREEAASPGASPVSVIDGLGLARLCEEHGVGVVRETIGLALPDLDLMDGLRGG